MDDEIEGKCDEYYDEEDAQGNRFCRRDVR